MDRQLDLPDTTRIVWLTGFGSDLPRYSSMDPQLVPPGHDKIVGFTRFWNAVTEDWMKVSLALA
jgi:hypothetical protein